MQVLWRNILNLMFLTISNYIFNNIPLLLKEFKFSNLSILWCLLIGYGGIPFGMFIFHKYKKNSSLIFTTAVLIFANLSALLKETNEFILLTMLIFIFYTTRYLITSTLRILYADTTSLRFDMFFKTLASVASVAFFNLNNAITVKLVFLICSIMVLIHLFNYHHAQPLQVLQTDVVKLYTHYPKIMSFFTINAMIEIWISQFLGLTLRNMGYNFMQVSQLIVVFMLGQLMTHFPFILLIRRISNGKKLLILTSIIIFTSLMIFIYTQQTSWQILAIFLLGSCINTRYAPREYLNRQLIVHDIHVDIVTSLDFVNSILMVIVLILQTLMSGVFEMLAMPIGSISLQFICLFCLI